MYQQASELLIDAAGLAVASAVVPDKTDPQNHIALLMSATEKATLIRSLTLSVSRTLNANEVDGGPMQAMKVILKALNQDWRLAK